jgi:hypothetical protein
MSRKEPGDPIVFFLLEEAAKRSVAPHSGVEEIHGCSFTAVHLRRFIHDSSFTIVHLRRFIHDGSFTTVHLRRLSGIVRSVITSLIGYLRWAAIIRLVGTKVMPGRAPRE